MINAALRRQRPGVRIPSGAPLFQWLNSHLSGARPRDRVEISAHNREQTRNARTISVQGDSGAAAVL